MAPIKTSTNIPMLLFNAYSTLLNQNLTFAKKLKTRLYIKVHPLDSTCKRNSSLASKSYVYYNILHQHRINIPHRWKLSLNLYIKNPFTKEFSLLLRRTRQSNYCKANIYYKAMRVYSRGSFIPQTATFPLTKPQTTHTWTLKNF